MSAYQEVIEVLAAAILDVQETIDEMGGPTADFKFGFLDLKFDETL